jgi:hypothetical protein
VEKTLEECQEVANKEQIEEKEQTKSKASQSSGIGAVRSKRNGRRNTGTFEGLVLASGSRRTRRPSAKARSSQ